MATAKRQPGPSITDRRGKPTPPHPAQSAPAPIPDKPPVALRLQRDAGNQAVRSLIQARRAAGLTTTPFLATARPAASAELLTVARTPVGAGPVVVQRAPGPLTAAQQKAAVTFNRAHYDRNSVRVIQVIVGTGVDGKFGAGSAQAVATFQSGKGLTQTGQVDEPTLNQVVAACVAGGNQNYAIYATANFFALPVRANTLTVRFDAALGSASASTFEIGNLRVIRLGPTAMTSAAKIRDAINVELAKAPPAVAAPGAVAATLTPAKEKAALAVNRRKFRDPRSVRAIQAAVGGVPDGVLTGDTIERIAAFQNGKGLTADGKIGHLTLAKLVAEWDSKGAQNGAIRAIVDFYRLDENGLVNINFDTADANNATTTAMAIPGDSNITVGPSAFAQGFAGLVHTIAHEFEHVRQNRVGIADIPISEFLGERVEILSRGMDEEDLAGFMDDAGRALSQWNAMPVGQRRANWSKFVEVRAKVRARLAKATALEKLPHLATLAGYNAVVKP